MICQRHLVLIVIQWQLKNCEPELSYILAELFSKCLKESSFPYCWKVSSVVPVFKNVGERSTAKNYGPVSLFSVVSKVFEKLVNNRIVDHLEKYGLFLISSMVLVLLDQLLIFSQLYLIELLGLLTGLGLFELWHLIYPRLLTGFGMLVFFTNIKLMSATFYHFFIFSPNDRPLKTIKNVVYFIKKAFFVLEIFKFLIFFPSFPQFPGSKGQIEVEYIMVASIDLHKFTDAIFGITQKLFYITLSNLVR